MSKIDSMQELIDKLDLDNNASINDICDSALIVIKDQERMLDEVDTKLTENYYELASVAGISDEIMQNTPNSVDFVCKKAIKKIQENDNELIRLRKLETNSLLNSQEQFTLEEIKYLVSNWITKFGLTKVFQGYLDNFSEYFSSKFKAQTLFTKIATQANKKIKQDEKNHRKIEQHHRLLCLALKAAKNSNHNGNYYTHYFRDNLTDLLVAETERVYDEINRVNDISDLDF